MDSEVYLRLAKHLDSLPDGFPPSSTGADLRLLEMLFSPEEAALAVHMTLEREGAGVIAERAGLLPVVTGQLLEKMAQKGLIFSTRDKNGALFYEAAPFVVGIYELQVNNLSPDLLEAIDAYWSTAEDKPRPKTVAQMRVIPVGQSIDTRLEALTYEQVGELIKSQTLFAVAPCICRRRQKLKGAGCAAPEESCLIFGDWADFYIRTGRAREIDYSELNNILARADAANLVLRPSNSREISFICCCCGCCCGGLRGLRNHPRPADAVTSAFIARFDPEACQGCWTCLDRCQTQALVENGDIVSFKEERCIGCGLCVTTCPDGALTLVRKPDYDQEQVPPTMDATWQMIREAQMKII